MCVSGRGVSHPSPHLQNLFPHMANASFRAPTMPGIASSTLPFYPHCPVRSLLSFSQFLEDSPPCKTQAQTRTHLSVCAKRARMHSLGFLHASICRQIYMRACAFVPTCICVCVCTASRDILTHETGCPLRSFHTNRFASIPILYVLPNPGKAKGIIDIGGGPTMACWPNSACHLVLETKFTGTQPGPFGYALSMDAFMLQW